MVQELAGVPRGAMRTEFRPIDGASTEFSRLMDGRRLVIRGSTEWETFWNDLHRHVTPIPALPVIDFGLQTVIAAAMGSRPSGGHSIRIEEVSEDDQRVFAIVVGGVGREVEFVTRFETLECD